MKGHVPFSRRFGLKRITKHKKADVSRVPTPAFSYREADGYFVAAAFFADSIVFAIAGKHASGGRSSVVMRSLSRKPARFDLRGGASVSMSTGISFFDGKIVRRDTS
jgi:hypothetical protein